MLCHTSERINIQLYNDADKRTAASSGAHLLPTTLSYNEIALEFLNCLAWKPLDCHSGNFVAVSVAEIAH